MAKKCPITNEYVLYVDCLECDDKYECQNGTLQSKENDNLIQNDLNKNDSNDTKGTK
jgi:hypothetical protein